MTEANFLDLTFALMEHILSHLSFNGPINIIKWPIINYLNSLVTILKTYDYNLSVQILYLDDF